MKTWLLPILLATAQLAWWPGSVLAGYETVEATGPVVTTVGVLAIVVVTAALGLRLRRPVVALAGVVGGLTVAFLVTPIDAPLLIGAADLIALYSVAVRDPQRTWLSLGLLAPWQLGVGAIEYGFSGEWVIESGFLVVGYLVTVGAGMARRQWLAGRRAAADALRQAETARREAGDGERRRLSAELHDVSAHHLTSIVVTMNAARRLAAGRPDLLAESLAMAANTGREALTDLRGLLADAGPSPAGGQLTDRLAELTDAFTRLGQQVTVEAPNLDTLPPAVAEAAHAIVREALTNTVRYAPGAAVRVRLTLTTPAADAPQLGIVVENDIAAGAVGGAGRLGSGRGLTGLRRRATGLGGTLDAEPRADGGWRVTASLPVVERGVPGDARWWSAHRTPVFDLAVVVLMLAVGIASLVMPDEDTWAMEPAVLRTWPTLLVIAHVLPLLLRRRAPWLAWFGVFATFGLWPLWLSEAGVTDRLAAAVVFGFFAEFAAVYAVSAYARNRLLSLLVIPASSAVLTVAVTAEFATAGWTVDGDRVEQAVAVAIAVFSAALFALPATAVWGLGFAVRVRRDGVVQREHQAVTTAVAAAEAEARAERSRLVTGLRQQVLEQTGLVVAAAESEDPDEVLRAARAALAAMRELLTALDPPSGVGPTRLPVAAPAPAAGPGAGPRAGADGAAVAVPA
ncbi:histidine kinase [Cryptosporangium aurantiacum]|uniref:histidine kinase n=1 Tax=Cryptosporangium aurantiacum TaxID=134849 RepID=A0A1M7QS56_9ACTN|nr:histidine kinase [Cryptosporangium aurantiacum]SHN34115.1 Signal transduction histidine kinase [Cryptosporangium aurantiacum]